MTMAETYTEHNISAYKEGTHFNHAAKRDRILLLKKAEMRKLMEKSQEKGLTITVSKLFINDRGFAKLEIALAKGKKLYDKREDIAKKSSISKDEMLKNATLNRNKNGYIRVSKVIDKN